IMRIAMFSDTYTPQINGVVTSINTFMRELRAKGHEVYIFGPQLKGVTEKDFEFRFQSAPYLFHTEQRLVYPYSRKLKQFKDLGIDIIHSHTPFGMGWLALRMAKKYKLPLVHTYHTLFTEYVHYVPLVGSGIMQWVAKRVSRDYCNGCNWVITPSEAMKKELETYGVKSEISVIPTGIDITMKEKGQAEAARERYGISPEQKILMYAGRLGKEKNIDFLLRSFRKVVQKNENCIFVIAGDGPYRKNLEWLTKALHLERKVFFTGYLNKEDIASLYKAASLFIFASVTETQGLVIGEAMDMGTPVVAVNAMGIADVIEGDKGGLASSLDVHEFSEKILTLLNDENLYQQKAAETVKIGDEMCTEIMANKLIDGYEKILATKAPRHEE
ncbi:MAG: glycosyltransferase family 4 protein, partial [Candidatus Margulisbacteria bacterium]|nr:glycosyltransferase family 4 protein [Candidatus Margulisiibacteriota bacterium]